MRKSLQKPGGQNQIVEVDNRVRQIRYKKDFATDNSGQGVYMYEQACCQL